MIKYRYSAIDKQGRKLQGVITAREEISARSSLSEEDIVIVSLKPVDQRDWFKLERSRELDLQTVARFSRELSDLLKAGAPLRKALKIMSQDKSKSASFAAHCLNNLDQGKQLSEAFDTHHGPGELLREFIRAGEAGGGLEMLLDSAHRFISARLDAISKIRKALAYPLFISLLGIIALLVITIYVAPALAPIIEENEEGGFILQLAAIGSGIRANSQIVFVCLAMLVLAIFILLRQAITKHWIEAAAWRIPWIGSALRDLDTGQSCEVLAALLDKGRPLDTALKFAATVCGTQLSKTYLSITGKLHDGVVASEAFASEEHLPKDVRRLILLGERSSAFAHAIRNAGTICHNRALQRIDRMSAILGPALVIGLGGVISLLMLSVLGTLGQLGEVG